MPSFRHGSLPAILLALLASWSSPGPAAAHEAEVTPKPKLLQNDLPQDGLALPEGEGVVFKIIVPAGAQNLVVLTRGGHGDLDLFVRHNAHPTPTIYDAESTGPVNREKVRIAQPESGAWYVLLYAVQGYAEVELTAHYLLRPGAVAAVQLRPEPGVYAGRATVRLRSPAPNAQIHYTIDGSAPTDASPLYAQPLSLLANTRLRTRSYNRQGSAGPEIEGYYDVQPTGTVTALAGNTAVHHLAAVRQTEHLFKITVPADTASLVIRTEGGRGTAELAVRPGAVPTKTEFTSRKLTRRSATEIKLATPAAGDWFIALKGHASFSGVSISALTRPDGVDLITWQPTLDPSVSTESFSSGECEVQEGMITAGTHRLLRFSTETRNIGARDLVMPKPEGNPAFEFAECHGHYHFKGFASYRLLNSTGGEVATGKKVSFCLEDIKRWDADAPADYHFTCEDQGIQAGWGDIYDGGLPGQWIDITDVAPGTYTLEVTMNPQHILPEVDYTNNTATLPVTITAP